MPASTQGGLGRSRAAPASPVSPGATEYLAIGEVASSHGVRGFFCVHVLTDFPNRFQTLRWVYFGEEHRKLTVERVRVLPDRVLMKVEGVDTPEAARVLSRQLLYVPVSDAVPLSEGEYYWFQIIGLQVCTEDGRLLGKVTDILATGSNDVYVVHGPEGEVLVPAIEDVIRRIDLDSGQLVIEPLPGML